MKAAELLRPQNRRNRKLHTYSRAIFAAICLFADLNPTISLQSLSLQFMKLHSVSLAELPTTYLNAVLKLWQPVPQRSLRRGTKEEKRDDGDEPRRGPREEPHDSSDPETNDRRCTQHTLSREIDSLADALSLAGSVGAAMRETEQEQPTHVHPTVRKKRIATFLSCSVNFCVRPLFRGKKQRLS